MNKGTFSAEISRLSSSSGSTPPYPKTSRNAPAGRPIARFNSATRVSSGTATTGKLAVQPEERP
jgi:hypothetical protein